MELFLNSCWLLLAACVTLQWWRQSHPAQRFRRQVCGLVAIGCALILLFPIISESDDLHVLHQEMEDVRVKAGGGEIVKAPSSRSAHISPALPADSRAATELHVMGPVHLRSTTMSAWRSLLNSPPRSPPSLSSRTFNC